MKKLMYFAAALLVLVGCNNKDNTLNNAPEGTPFKKGQQVTLTIGTGNNANQVTPRKVAGIDNTTDNRIDFTWEEGDKILVKVGDKTAEFILSSEPGLNEGEFVGTMPAAGSTFDIQYPTTTPDLSTQVYTATKTIPADKMAFAAEGCTLDNPATLLAQYAMVQLNLYGTDKTVGKIVFTNTTAEPAVSYTLTCTGGKAIGATSATATPFYMVVPTGTYLFEAEIWDNATTPAKICSFATSAANTFTAGGCLNMPAKYVPTYVDLGLSVKWATCNVGATKPEEYGDYFAWGETTTKTDYSESNYTYTDNPTVLPADHDAARQNWGGKWRMPTKAEFEELINPENCKWEYKEDYNGTSVNGYLVTSQKAGYTNISIFLPASGHRSVLGLREVGTYGNYWSSSLYENPVEAWLLLFYKSHMNRYGDNRSKGRPVRPVCPIN